jgi:transposase
VGPGELVVIGCAVETVARAGRPGETVLVIRVRSKIGRHDRCPSCLRRCPVYDHSPTRRWRAVDWGRTRVFVQARPVRVSCVEHGVVTAVVAWARPDARHTRAFEQVAAWCATQMSGTAAATLLRCTWRTIGELTSRVADDLVAVAAAGGDDGLDRLRRIGIDEISYRRGHHYLVVVVDHDTRRLVWARPGRDRTSMNAFFDALGPDRTAALTHVTSDSAAWIARPLRDRAPHVIHCADPFHVVRWAGEGLNLVRRQVWNAVRRTPAQGGGRNKPAVGAGKTINKATWALRKDPDDWTTTQTAAMEWVKINHPRLHRAWRLKEALREVFALKGFLGIALLDRWISWARRSRIPEMVDVARKIVTHRTEIDACLIQGLANGLTESVNTKIRLIARRAYGFRNVNALIALAKLSLGHHRPTLPT